MLKLNTGYSIPILGYGTYKLTEEDAYNGTLAALNAGYRHIDTATVYRNEEQIGRAVAAFIASGKAKREDIFITSKLAPKDQGYESAKAAVRKSLELLNAGWIDLYLIHWPGTQGIGPSSSKNAQLRQESWRALEECVREGLVRSIGVSNYTVEHLQQLCEYCTIVPAIHQFELHVCYYDRNVVDWCEKKGIVVESYSTLGTGKLCEEEYCKEKLPLLSELAEKYAVDVSNILLSWAANHNWIILPKSKNPERIVKNMKIVKFTSTEMAALDNISLKHLQKFCWDPQVIV